MLDAVSNVAQGLALTGGAIGGLYGLYRLVLFIYRTAKFADKVYHEMIPNEGSSMRDAIDRIELALEVLPNLVARVSRIEKHVGLDDAA